MNGYGYMTLTEFKDALQKAGLSHFHWEGILNIIALGQEHMAEEMDRLGDFPEIAAQYRRREYAILDILTARGYFDMT